MIEVTMLGTSCMVPTKERNVSGMFLKYKGEGILLDCGEGTQRQMNIAGLKRTAVTKILISHWHGDHVSGIIGLIQTMGNDMEPPTVNIYGPRETKKRVEHMMQTCIFDSKVEVIVHELEPKAGEVLRFIDNDDYAIECARLDHKVPCIGYSFIEKERLNIDVEKQKKLGLSDGPYLKKIKRGQDAEYKGKTVRAADITYAVPQKKFAYVADTEACGEATLLAKDADVLVAESTFLSEQREKSELRKHMTSQDAALVAEQAGVGKLILTHFSQRYTTADIFEEDARVYFKESYAAFDFMKIKI